jgi:hypothetical protein
MGVTKSTSDTLVSFNNYTTVEERKPNEKEEIHQKERRYSVEESDSKAR